jgi:hypothetical protein
MKTTRYHAGGEVRSPGDLEKKRILAEVVECMYGGNQEWISGRERFNGR